MVLEEDALNLPIVGNTPMMKPVEKPVAPLLILISSENVYILSLIKC